jgi:hypothetical protein
MAIGRGSSSSKRVRFLSSRNTKTGRVDEDKTLNLKGVREFRDKAFAILQSKIAGGLQVFFLYDHSS